MGYLHTMVRVGSARRGHPCLWSLRVIGAFLLLGTTTPSLAQVTGLYIDSPPGDFVGQGQQYTVPASEFFEATHYQYFAKYPVESIEVKFGEWRANFGMPAYAEFLPGNYENTERHPFQGPRFAGLVVSGYGRGCNEATGWLRIHEFLRIANSVTILAADFIQSCDGGPPLYGSIRINSSFPLAYPEPYARASTPMAVTEGQPVALDATRSFSRVAQPLTVQWVQLSGTPVALSGANSATATFEAPGVATSLEPLVFRVTVTDTNSATDSLDVTVNVYDTTAPRMRAFIRAEPGNFVVGDEAPVVVAHSYDEADTLMSPRVYPPQTGFLIDIDSSEQWTLHLETFKGADWQPGTYAAAQRAPFNGAPRPGLSFGGEGRGCNAVIGWFEVAEIEFVEGDLQKLAVDFVHVCDDGVPDAPMFGAVRYMSAVPLDRNVLYSVAGPDVGSIVGHPLWLDGTQSFTRDTAPLQYSWQQISGPTAEIVDPAAALTAIVPPDGSADMVFQLTVSDGSGRTDMDTVRVRVRSPDELQSYLIVDSQPGDYVGFGQFWLMTNDNSLFALSQNAFGDPSLYVDGVVPWSLRLKTGTGALLSPGIYDDATAYSPLNTGQPGINLTGPAPVCPGTVNGRFDVLSIAYSDDGIESLAVDFEQRCGQAPLATGQLRHNLVPSTLPVARAGADRTVIEGHSISLDGSASADDGAIASHQWEQIGGPTVTLQGADTATPTIVSAPAAGAVLRLRLVVTDNSGNLGVDLVYVNVLQDLTDTDGDGVRDLEDAFPNDPNESVDTDDDGIGDNADTDDDNDGSPDSVENLAPGGDGNGDGVPDSKQSHVYTLTDVSGSLVTVEAGAGATLVLVKAVANPNPGASPSGYRFDRGFFALELDVAVGAGAIVTMWVHGAPQVAAYYKYDASTSSFYRFLYNGTTGAQLLSDRIVLHFKDGLAGDSDGVANGHIVDPGAPAWSAGPSGGGSGGGPTTPTTLLALLAMAWLRVRIRRPA